LSEDNKWAYIVLDDYTVMIGTKSNIIIGTEKDLADCFFKTLINDYKTIENFIASCINRIKDISWNDTISLLYENIPEFHEIDRFNKTKINRLTSLTVCYTKSSMEFLGLTYDDKLILADDAVEITGNIEEWFLGETEKALSGLNKHLE